MTRKAQLRSSTFALKVHVLVKHIDLLLPFLLPASSFLSSFFFFIPKLGLYGSICFKVPTVRENRFQENAYDFQVQCSIYKKSHELYTNSYLTVCFVTYTSKMSEGLAIFGEALDSGANATAFHLPLCEFTSFPPLKKPVKEACQPQQIQEELPSQTQITLTRN